MVSVLMSDIRGLLDHRRAGRPERAGPPAQRPPGRDEQGDRRRRGHRHAVRGRRRHGRLRCARALDDHAARAVEAALAMHAGPGRGEPALARTRACLSSSSGIGITTRPGGGGAARLGRAPRVHAGRRHRQPGPAPPAVGRARAKRSCPRRPTSRWRTRPRPRSCRPRW